MRVHFNLPPHTLESQKRDTNGFIAIQESFLIWPIFLYQGCIQDFCQGGPNLEYVKNRGGEAVRSCRAAAGGWVYLEIQGEARITQGGECPPLNTPLLYNCFVQKLWHNMPTSGSSGILIHFPHKICLY